MRGKRPFVLKASMWLVEVIHTHLLPLVPRKRPPKPDPTHSGTNFMNLRNLYVYLKNSSVIFFFFPQVHLFSFFLVVIVREVFFKFSRIEFSSGKHILRSPWVLEIGSGLENIPNVFDCSIALNPIQPNLRIYPWWLKFQTDAIVISFSKRYTKAEEKLFQISTPDSRLLQKL